MLLVYLEILSLHHPPRLEDKPKWSPFYPFRQRYPLYSLCVFCNLPKLNVEKYFKTFDEQTISDQWAHVILSKILVSWRSWMVSKLKLNLPYTLKHDMFGHTLPSSNKRQTAKHFSFTFSYIIIQEQSSSCKGGKNSLKMTSNI